MSIILLFIYIFLGIYIEVNLIEAAAVRIRLPIISNLLVASAVTFPFILVLLPFSLCKVPVIERRVMVRMVRE